MQERIAVRGSNRQPLPNAVPAGAPDPNAPVNVTLILRRRTAELPRAGSRRVTREEFAELYGADPADLLRVEEFAAENDLTIAEVDLARRSVVLAGTVANMNEAFGTQLRLFQTPNGT